MQTRTDARGVVTTYGYDGLHRLTSVSYDVGTTGVPATQPLTFTYGTSATDNNVGRLLKLEDGVSSAPATYTSDIYTYDAMGRITGVSKTAGWRLRNP